MNIQENGYLSIEQLTDRYLSPSRKGEAGKTTDGKTTDGLSFKEVLWKKSISDAEEPELKFSKHAALRLADRNIELTNEQFARLEDGTRKAGKKGIRDSLVIVDQLAFIVNVPNRTVVTAMDSTETSDNVFTNINGAVIM